MKLVKKYITPILLLLLSIIVYKNWLNFSILSYGDYVYYFHESLSTFIPISVWKTNFGFGSVDILLWRTPQNIIYGLLGSLGLDLNIIDRFVVLWLWVILSWLSIYLLLKYIFKSKIAVFIGSLIFIFNTYSLSISSQGQLLISIAGCFAILSLLFFIKLMVERKLVYAALSILFLFLTASYDLRILYLAVLLLFSYFVFYILFIDKFRVTNFFKTSLYALVPMVGFGILSLYWIFPLMHSSSLTGNSILTRTLFGNEFLNINYAFTLFHPFWTGGVPAWFEVQEIPIYFWLIPFFVFLGLVFGIKNKLVLFFGLVSLVGIFLTKQVSIPFPFVYEFLFKYLPGFSAFREASKFYFLIIIGYSVLIAAFVEWILKKKRKKYVWKYETYSLLILIIGLFLWNTKPFLTGEIGSLLVSRKINHEYFTLRNYINSQNNFFRVAWIPTSSRWHISTDNHPEVSVVSMLMAGPWETLSEKGKPSNDLGGEMINSFLQQENANDIFDSSSIKYIVIPQQEEAEADVFIPYGKTKKYYLDQLDHLDWLKRIDIGTKSIIVYENKDSVPRIFTTNTATFSGRFNSYSDPVSRIPNTKFSSVSSTEYTVKISQIKNPLYLHFSESYHPDWKIHIGEFNWVNALLDKNYFLSDANHYKNQFGLNSYLIDPNKICKRFVCQRNKDGSYTIDITLYFVPQVYLYVGGIITCFSLATIVGYVIYNLIKYSPREEKDV